jgi:predicted peptidase
MHNLLEFLCDYLKEVRPHSGTPNNFVEMGEDPGQNYGYIAIAPPNARKLLFYLHGIGERGNGKGELSYLEKNGIPKVNKSGLYNETEFLTICPQCPVTSDKFYHETLYKFAAHFVKKGICGSEIYLTGLSMGAYSISIFLEKLKANQSKFADLPTITVAAAVLVAGTGEAGKATYYPEIFLRTVHGNEDTVTSPSFSKNLVKTYNDSHEAGLAEYVEMPYMRHENAMWDSVYRSPDTYNFLLS